MNNAMIDKNIQLLESDNKQDAGAEKPGKDSEQCHRPLCQNHGELSSWANPLL